MTSSDRVLSQLIKTTPLGFDSLLASSLQPAIQASSSRRQQDMLMAALRSNSRASRPARRDRSRSPVRRPHSNQNHSQGFRQSTDRQPFRESSCGSGSRGTRGSRGSRGQRPFSRRSWISGPSGTVQGMVGPLRKGRFCARSGQGSSARIRVEASSIKTETTSGGKNKLGKGEGPPGGGRLPPEQRSRERVKDRKRGFYSQHFPSGQEGQGA